MDVEVDADMVEEKLEEEEEEEAEEAEEEEEAEQEDEENSSEKKYITTLTWQVGKNDVIYCNVVMAWDYPCFMTFIIYLWVIVVLPPNVTNV